MTCIRLRIFHTSKHLWAS